MMMVFMLRESGLLHGIPEAREVARRDRGRILFHVSSAGRTHEDPMADSG